MARTPRGVDIDLTTEKHLYILDADRSNRMRLSAWGQEEKFSVRSFLSSADLIEALPYLQCGILLLQIGNAVDEGFGVVEAVRRAKPSCPIIAMTAAADTRVVVEALKRGAVDFLPKPIRNCELHEAVASAGVILEQQRGLFVQIQNDRDALERLTVRERDVLRSMAGGKISKTIAGELALSVRTVESYRSTLIEKLGVGTAGAAVAVLVRYQTAVRAQGLHDSGLPGV